MSKTSEWNDVLITYVANNPNLLPNLPCYYYSESEPTLNEDGTAYDGNYWKYDTDGVTPIVWVYTKE